MNPKGKYVYMTQYDPDTDTATHSVRARVLRNYAKRSLRLIDGPGTVKIVAGSAKNDGARQGVWFPIPKIKGVCDRGSYNMNRYGCCGQSHLLAPSDIRKFCIEELGMTEEKTVVVEVERIVEKLVETPLPLSFEERDILVTALRREQHHTNDMLRQAYEADDEQRASLLVGRMDELLSLMARLGIQPDDWANGPTWLVGVDFTQRVVEEAPQLNMFADDVQLTCTSDDPSNHQGNTCPVHEGGL